MFYMVVNVTKLCNWFKEYAAENESTLDIYRTGVPFDGNLSENNLLEIKRKNKSNIVIRWYNYEQLKIDLSGEKSIEVLGISFLRNQQTQKEDNREYVIDSVGNIDHYNKIELLPDGTKLKDAIQMKKTVREKLFYLLDHHDEF